jgi:hypothetical protein
VSSRGRKAAKESAPAPTSVRFSWRTGAPFNEEDAALVGAELLKLARASCVADVASLNPREVFEAIYADADHPLRKMFGDFKDVEGAARRHWIQMTGTMIRSISVQIVALPGRALEPVRPMFVHAEARVKEGDGTTVRRRRVLTEDALKSDPAFISAVGFKIRAITDALAGLESLTAWGHSVPPEIAQLRDSLRHAIDSYHGAIAQAAE